MLSFFLFDAYEAGAFLVMALFVVFFALLLNPPTKWVKKYWGRSRS